MTACEGASGVKLSRLTAPAARSSQPVWTRRIRPGRSPRSPKLVVFQRLHSGFHFGVILGLIVVSRSAELRPVMLLGHSISMKSTPSHMIFIFDHIWIHLVRKASVIHAMRNARYLPMPDVEVRSKSVRSWHLGCQRRRRLGDFRQAGRASSAVRTYEPNRYGVTLISTISFPRNSFSTVLLSMGWTDARGGGVFRAGLRLNSLLMISPSRCWPWRRWLWHSWTVVVLGRCTPPICVMRWSGMHCVMCAREAGRKKRGRTCRHEQGPDSMRRNEDRSSTRGQTPGPYLYS